VESRVIPLLAAFSARVLTGAVYGGYSVEDIGTLS